MNEKINFFKQYVYAICKPKEYSRLIRLGNGRLFLHTLLLAFVTSLILFCPLGYSYVKQGGLEKIANQYLPDFDYKDGILHLDLQYNQQFEIDKFGTDLSQFSNSSELEELQPYLLYSALQAFSTYESTAQNMTALSQQSELSDSFYLYIDTDTNNVSDAAIDLSQLRKEDIIIITAQSYAYGNAADLSSDSLEENLENGALESASYDKTLIADSFSKTELLRMIRSNLPVIYAVFAGVFLLFLLFNLAGWYVAAFIYAIVALIAKILLKKNLTFGSLFKLSVYAQTTSILLTIINDTLLLVSASFFATVCRAITILYIAFAVYKLDDSDHNRQASPYYYYNGSSDYDQNTTQQNDQDKNTKNL